MQSFLFNRGSASVMSRNETRQAFEEMVFELFLKEKRYLKKIVNKLILQVYSPIDHGRAPNLRLRCARSNLARLDDLSACQRARIQLQRA